MLEVAEGSVESWLDSQSAPRLAAQLAARLRERTRGEKGVFLTLTYRPREWPSARELWRSQGEQQHVPLFMRRLARAIGHDVRGKWICKAEFQKNGFVHFHLILLGVTWIDHATLSRAWGFGFAYVKRLTPANLAYLCKYVGKDGDFPAYLYAERRVRIVRTSNGFWGESSVGGQSERAEPPFSIPAWIPIGQRISDARQRVVIRSEFGCQRLACTLRDVCDFATQRSAAITAAVGRWVAVAIEPEALAAWAGRKARPPALHLTQSGKHDAWVDRFLCEALAEREFAEWGVVVDG